MIEQVTRISQSTEVDLGPTVGYETTDAHCLNYYHLETLQRKTI